MQHASSRTAASPLTQLGQSLIRFRAWTRAYGLALSALAATALPSLAAPVFPYPYTKEILPNGLTAIIIPMESPGQVAYYSVVRTGSRDEVEEGKSGFAHFFEHMMFRGTKKFPSDVYEGIVASIGASANASTTD